MHKYVHKSPFSILWGENCFELDFDKSVQWWKSLSSSVSTVCRWTVFLYSIIHPPFLHKMGLRVKSFSFSLPPQGKLSLHNECNGNVSVFILKGVGEHPLPVDHVVLHCPVGQTTRTQLNVPNYSQKRITAKVYTYMEIHVMY